jgi:hypothetical protein
VSPRQINLEISSRLGELIWARLTRHDGTEDLTEALVPVPVPLLIEQLSRTISDIVVEPTRHIEDLVSAVGIGRSQMLRPGPLPFVKRTREGPHLEAHSAESPARSRAA